VFTTAAPVEDVRGQIRAGPKTFFLKKPVSLNQVRTVLTQVMGLPADAIPAAAASAPVPAAAPASVPAAAAPAPATSPAESAFPAASAASSAAPAQEGPAAEPAAAPNTPSVPEPAVSASASVAVSPPAPASVPAPAPVAASAEAAGGSTESGHVHQFEVRVIYGDTDKMGVIYYANYFKYFEQGRAELMRSLGIRYRDLELLRKIFLPVVETRCKYLGPAKYDDLLLVRTRLSRLGTASVWFSYEIVSREGGDRIVAEGFTRHAIVNDQWKPIAVPADLREKLSGYVNHTGA
jgi:acyl-CoA thioester hydrolase